jgi:hypothetical protein
MALLQLGIELEEKIESWEARQRRNEAETKTSENHVAALLERCIHEIKRLSHQNTCLKKKLANYEAAAVGEDHSYMDEGISVLVPNTDHTCTSAKNRSLTHSSVLSPCTKPLLY